MAVPFHFFLIISHILWSGLFLSGNWLFLYEAYQHIGVSLATLMCYCGPILIMILSYFVFHKPFTVPKVAAMVIVTVGIVNTGLGYYLYFSGVQRLSAQSVSICGYMEPFTALALSAILLGESLTVLQWLGAACILGGVALSERWHPGKKR
ncbi:DMT family transporter [uncultured Megasphaera sp.]|uniref:DMT family transporter n=1 Tax=uncultured Megasphaera sp. TaxID=165188 RepID=UPI002868F148|nr:DMT family transporter [uncultured Megasphaera sp.]